MKKLLISFGLVSLITGCASTGTLQNASAAKLGGSPENIKIASVSNSYKGITTWNASCDGKSYHCESLPSPGKDFTRFQRTTCTLV